MRTAIPLLARATLGAPPSPCLPCQPFRRRDSALTPHLTCTTLSALPSHLGVLQPRVCLGFPPLLNVIPGVPLCLVCHERSVTISLLPVYRTPSPFRPKLVALPSPIELPRSPQAVPTIKPLGSLLRLTGRRRSSLPPSRARRSLHLWQLDSVWQTSLCRTSWMHLQPSLPLLLTSTLPSAAISPFRVAWA